jgi:type IV pilus assembly protein PilB
VRRLCVDCREAIAPDLATLKQLGNSFRLSDNGGIKQLHELEELALQDGIGKASKETSELSTTASTVSRLWKAHEDGCEHCNHSGYKGRIGIYEVLTNSPEVQKLIVGNSTSEEIEKAAIDNHMISMQLDGLVKALRGETTIEEVLRVTTQG